MNRVCNRCAISLAKGISDVSETLERHVPRRCSMQVTAVSEVIVQYSGGRPHRGQDSTAAGVGRYASSDFCILANDTKDESSPPGPWATMRICLQIWGLTVD